MAPNQSDNRNQPPQNIVDSITALSKRPASSGSAGDAPQKLPVPVSRTLSLTSTSSTCVASTALPDIREEIRPSEIGVTESVLHSAVSREKPRGLSIGAAGGGGEKLGTAGDDEGKSYDDDDGPHGEEVVDTYPEGGFRAWKTVFASFILVCCCNGYGLVWGVLVQDLHQKSQKNTPLSTLNFSIGVANFILCFVSFVAGRMGDKYGYKRVISISVFGQFISFVASSFVSHSLVGLFLVQGVMLGISQGIGLPLFMTLPSRWFLRRRGLATGIAASGAGFGGAISSLIVRALLPRLGYGHTLLVYGCVNFAFSVLALILIEEREMESSKGKPRVNKNWLPTGVWNDPAFYSLMIATVIGLMGFLTVFFYLTTYTQVTCPQLDPTSITPAVPLIVANFMSGFGRVFAGRFADMVGPVNAMLVSFTLGGLFQLVIWPLANTFGKILALAALYGFACSWYLSLLPVVCAQLWGLKGLATITGLGVLMTGPGQLAGAPISGVILSRTGGNYAAVAYYSGANMMLGAAILTIARFSREKGFLKKF
ncbi:MFS general substrate transporter [Meredithblackwellia eburnea MCA 4105]